MKVRIVQVDTYFPVDVVKELETFETDSIDEAMKKAHTIWNNNARNKDIMQRGEQYIVFPKEKGIDIALYDTYME